MEIGMVNKNFGLCVIVIILSLKNVNAITSSKCTSFNIQRLDLKLQLRETNQNIYTFKLVLEGSESPKMAAAREIMWNNYLNHIPTTIVIRSITKEGRPVIEIFNLKANEDGQWVVLLEVGDIKEDRYYPDGYRDYEIRGTGVYDQISPIKPPKSGLVPRKFISKDNLPNSQQYRLLLKSSATNEENVF